MTPPPPPASPRPARRTRSAGSAASARGRVADEAAPQRASRGLRRGGGAGERAEQSMRGEEHAPRAQLSALSSRSLGQRSNTAASASASALQPLTSSVCSDGAHTASSDARASSSSPCSVTWRSGASRSTSSSSPPPTPLSASTTRRWSDPERAARRNGQRPPGDATRSAVSCGHGPPARTSARKSRQTVAARASAAASPSPDSSRIAASSGLGSVSSDGGSQASAPAGAAASALSMRASALPPPAR